MSGYDGSSRAVANYPLAFWPRFNPNRVSPFPPENWVTEIMWSMLHYVMFNISICNFYHCI